MENVSLYHAVCKLAIAGEQAGFTVEQMIQLLNAGISIEILLEMIEKRLHPETKSPMPVPVSSLRWVM